MAVMSVWDLFERSVGAYIIRLGVKAVSHFWGISSEAISTFHVGGNLDGLLLLVDRAHDSEGFGV